MFRISTPRIIHIGVAVSVVPLAVCWKQLNIAMGIMVKSIIR